MRKKNNNLNKIILGLVFLGSFLLAIPSLSNVLTALRGVESGNQKPSQISTEKLLQEDKEPLASLEQKQCTADSDDFLYSDCTGFFE